MVSCLCFLGLTGAAWGQDGTPALLNGGFEADLVADQNAGWTAAKGPGRVEPAAEAARNGTRGLLVAPGAEERFCRQQIRATSHRPLLLTGWFRAVDVKVDPQADPEQYARFYIHIHYHDRPYADVTHLWVDIPPGTYDWRRLAVEIRPRPDLQPERLWITLAGRFTGTLHADDVGLAPVPPYPGADAATWERADEAVLISDLSTCSPKSALADRRSRGHWKVIDYATAIFRGRCLAALPETGALPVTLPIGVTGWHAIYLGLAGHPESGNMVRAKVSGDAAYQLRSHGAGDIEEVFLKCADLTGRDLQFAQQAAGYSQSANLMYVRLVPLTAAEAQAVQADAAQTGTKRLIGTIDGFSFLYDRRPTTRDELLEEFEAYRGTDFGTLWWCVTGADEVNYRSELGTVCGAGLDDFPRRGDGHYTASVRTLIRKGIDITRVAVEAAHNMGLQLHVGLRPAAWRAPPPYEEFFRSGFYDAHPEWRCRDRDGTPVMRMSFAVPEVREHLLGIFREVLQAEPDGLNVLFNRGMPLVLWEDAFCDLFRERYAEDARQVAEDDPRLYALRAEILTTFMRDVRGLLDERAPGGPRLALSAMVLETEDDNRKFGLDVEQWVKARLVDSLGVYRGSCHASGKPIDTAFFRRITEGTTVTVHPCMVAWALPGPGEMLRNVVGFYDQGADGVLFWDPTGLQQNGVLWPMVSRLGHLDEVRLRADMGAPKPVTLRLTEYGDHVCGRWTPMAGF